MTESARLRLRRLCPGDVDALLRVYGDAEAMRWVGDGRPLARADCVRWVGVTADNYRRRGYGMFALASRDDGAVVGFCGLVHPGGQAEAELKYALDRAHWGRGLATEAARALLAHAAQAWGLAQVLATSAPQNAASHRVLEKAGLRPDGQRREADGHVTQLHRWHRWSEGAPAGRP